MYGDPMKLSQIYLEELTALPDRSIKSEEKFLKIQDLLNNMKSANPNFNTKEVENMVTRKFLQEMVLKAYNRLHDTYPKLDFDLSVLLQRLEKYLSLIHISEPTRPY